MSFASCNQENFVTVAVEFKNQDEVLVKFWLDDKILRNNTIKQGRLDAVIKVPNNRLFYISFHNPKPDRFIKHVPIYNNPTLRLFTDDQNNSSFTIKANSMKDLYDMDKFLVVTSSKNQIDYSRYQSLLKKDRENNQAKFNALSKKQDNASSAKNDSLYTLYTDSLRFQEQLNKTSHNKVTRGFIANNPNSYVSMYLLSERLDLKNNLALYQLLYNKADRKYRKSWYGLYFAKRAEQLEKLKEKYIKKLEVNAFDVSGLSFNYGKYANSKLIVFDIWATWCVPCMEDMPAALKLAKELEGKSVSYVFLSYDFNDKYWKQQSQKLGQINSYYLSGKTRKFLDEELVVTTIPRYMILNNKGEVLVLDAPSPSSPGLKKLIESML